MLHLSDWLTVIVLGVCFGFGFTAGSAIANTIVGWMRK